MRIEGKQKLVRSEKRYGIGVVQVIHFLIGSGGKSKLPDLHGEFSSCGSELRLSRAKCSVTSWRQAGVGVLRRGFFGNVKEIRRIGRRRLWSNRRVMNRIRRRRGGGRTEHKDQPGSRIESDVVLL